MEYLEKIIQIPFHVPRLTSERLTPYAKDLMKPLDHAKAPEADPEQKDASPPSALERFRRLMQLFAGPGPTSLQPAASDEIREVPEPAQQRGALRLFSPPPIKPTGDETNLINQYAGYFSTSPRGVKRVVNLFRLAKSIHTRSRSNDTDKLDTNSLIRLIVLAERFPDFCDYLYAEAFQPGPVTKTMEAWVDEFVAAARLTADKLSAELKLARDAELRLLKKLCMEHPAMTPNALKEMAPYAVNLKPIRSWDSFLAASTPVAAPASSNGTG